MTAREYSGRRRRARALDPRRTPTGTAPAESSRCPTAELVPPQPDGFRTSALRLEQKGTPR